MYFDLDKIDKNLYFEFDINSNNIYRYSLDVNTLEISLVDLCYYLTRDIFREYRTKRFANPNLQHSKEVSFSFIIETKPQVIEIDVDFNDFIEFPLSVCLDQTIFSYNLNNTILLAIMKREEVYSYYKSKEDSEFFAVRKQNNNLWKHFPYYKQRIGSVLNKILYNAVYNLKFKFVAEVVYKIHLEKIIKGITYDIEQIEINSNEILQEYHEIINQIRKYERLFELSPQQEFNKFINEKLNILKKDINLYFNYFHGNFKKILKDDISDCHKKWALILLKKFKNQDFVKNGLETYLQDQVNEMSKQKKIVVEKMYQVQSDAVKLWNTLK